MSVGDAFICVGCFAFIHIGLLDGGGFGGLHLLAVGRKTGKQLFPENTRLPAV